MIQLDSINTTTNVNTPILTVSSKEETEQKQSKLCAGNKNTNTNTTNVSFLKKKCTINFL